MKFLKKYWLYIAIGVVVIIGIYFLTRKKDESADSPKPSGNTNANAYTNNSAAPTDGRPVMSASDAQRFFDMVGLTAYYLQGNDLNQDQLNALGGDFRKYLQFAFEIKKGNQGGALYSQWQKLFTDPTFMRVPVDEMLATAWLDVNKYVKVQ